MWYIKNLFAMVGHIKNWSAVMGHIKNWSAVVGHIKNWSVMMGHTEIDLINTNTVASVTSVSCSLCHFQLLKMLLCLYLM